MPVTLVSSFRVSHFSPLSYRLDFYHSCKHIYVFPQVLFLLSYLDVTLLSVAYLIVSILYCLLFIKYL